jgi:hypothetical protein
VVLVVLSVMPHVMVMMRVAPVVTSIIPGVMVAVVMPPVATMSLVMFLCVLCCRSRSGGRGSGGRRLARLVGRAGDRGLDGEQSEHQRGKQEAGNKFPNRHRDSFV